MLVVELSRDWLRAIPESGFIRTTVRCIHEIESQSVGCLQVAVVDQFPHELSGLPTLVDDGTWVSLRPIFRSAPSREQIFSRVTWSSKSSHAVFFYASSVELIREISEVLTSGTETKIHGEKLFSISSSIRQYVAIKSRLSIDSIIFVPPGSIPKTSSGKLRRGACRQGLLDRGLEMWQTYFYQTKT